MKRRELIKNSAASLGALALAPHIAACTSTEKKEMMTDLKGIHINHSVCRWCYSGIPLEEFADAAKDMGLKSIELLNESEWDTVLARGLQCGISNGSNLGIPNGFNDPKNHAQLQKDLIDLIPRAADKGIQQIICFSGNRNGISDEMGIEQCAIGLDPVVKMAQKYNVNIVMELLNSKVDHADYQCDNTPWGAALVDKLGSSQFKLLYDIYHMQIMEGDVIATIRKYRDYISHYHTGGVPGRNEINETQELYYPAIMKAIYETGFEGFVAQEFIPTRKDPLESLKEGLVICDV